MSEDSAFSFKRLLVGKPIPSSLAHHERLSRVTGLAVLSSDALSSVAYATDFILATLVVAGVGALVYAVPISLVIRSEEHTSELQPHSDLVCRLLLAKQKMRLPLSTPAQPTGPGARAP